MLPASVNYLKNIVLLDRDNRGIEAPSACHATPRRPVINGGCERPNNFHEPDWRHDQMTSCQRGVVDQCGAAGNRRYGAATRNDQGPKRQFMGNGLGVEMRPNSYEIL